MRAGSKVQARGRRRGRCVVRTREARAAIVRRFCDGDTLLAIVKCPECGIFHERRLRLARIESYELDGAERAYALKVAAQLTQSYAGKEAQVHVVRSSPDLYGRDIVELYVDGENVGDKLLKLGWAWPRPAGQVGARAVE